MSTFRQKRMLRHHRAFTLIELLVVIGIIAVIAGGIGLALGRGDRGTSLKTAQGTVSSILSGARAQAALNSSYGAVFINADPASDRFLREFRIAVDAGSANWQAKGDPIVLPAGIYLVPASSAFPTAQVEFVNTWTNLYSTAYSSTGLSLKDSAGNNIITSGASSIFHRITSFSVQGTTSAGQIVLSPAEIQAGGKIVFDKPEFVRGLELSLYGVSTFINDPEAF